MPHPSPHHARICELERKVKRLDAEAEDLRAEAAELEDQANRLQREIDNLKKAGESFVIRIAREWLGRPWAFGGAVVERLERLSAGAYDDETKAERALLEIGLLYGLPIPIEIEPSVGIPACSP